MHHTHTNRWGSPAIHVPRAMRFTKAHSTVGHSARGSAVSCSGATCQYSSLTIPDHSQNQGAKELAKCARFAPVAHPSGIYRMRIFGDNYIMRRTRYVEPNPKAQPQCLGRATSTTSRHVECLPRCEARGKHEQTRNQHRTPAQPWGPVVASFCAGARTVTTT